MWPSSILEEGMNLKAFIKNFTPEQLEDFAKRCGTSAGYLKQVAFYGRKAGETLAINIDRETSGQVRCEDLRPDVDWAYLRNSKPKKRRVA
jgi:DNA-binding transcriptional regulator YdaS (Cro superfamily)